MEEATLVERTYSPEKKQYESMSGLGFLGFMFGELALPGRFYDKLAADWTFSKDGPHIARPFGAILFGAKYGGTACATYLLVDQIMKYL